MNKELEGAGNGTHEVTGSPLSLRARAIEAAAKAVYERADDQRIWSQASPGLMATHRRIAECHVDAVLGVVADWCDEQTTQQELDVWVPLHDGKDRELSLGRQIGWVDAFRRMAERCRPVGEET